MASQSDAEPYEHNFHSAWNDFIKKFEVNASDDDDGAAATFLSKTDCLVTFWAYFVKEVPSKISQTCQDKLTELIRLHQMHVISPLWVEDGNIEVRQKLLGALKSANQKLQGAISGPVYQEYLTVLELHKDPWTGPILLPILSGKPEPRSIDFLIGESYVVCLHRLKLLLEGPSLVVAFHFADFIVQNVCHPDKRHSSLIVQRWNQNAKDISALLDAYLGLMFKLKKDSMLSDQALKTLTAEELIAAAERASLRRRKFADSSSEQLQSRLSTLDSIWSQKTAKRASEKLAEFSMCVAAKRKLDPAVLERIIQNWLSHFDDPKDSDLDLDAEKFSGLGIETGLAYEIASQILSKFGPTVRLMVVDIFVRALCVDVNRLDVAKANKNSDGVKSAEATISHGLVLLSKLIDGNLTFERECILTAFSLTPTDHLFKKVTELAERSGFVDSGPSLTDAGGKEEEKRLEKVSVPFQLSSDLDFDALCQQEELALSKGFSIGKSFRSAAREKIKRNLEGLVSVQGDLLTEAANYDPVKEPLQTLTPKSLGLPKQLVSDLLIVIESPRWHLLSWILDWHTLEERCLSLKSNPDMKNPEQELKFLVIDYTQFDEWSSDEEVMAAGGIEKGYEHWEKEVADEDVAERGLSGDEAEPEFNVVQKFDIENPDADNEDDILPEQYLPKRWRDYPEAAQPQPEAAHFLAAVGETEAVRSDLAGTNTRGLLRNSNPNSDEVRNKLKAIVPGLDESGQFSHPASSSEMEIGFCHIQFEVERRENVTATTCDADPTSEFVREKLRKVVPGLCDFSFFEPVEHFRPFVGVVHVTLANPTSSSQATSSSGATTSGSSQIGSTRKVVLESTSQSAEQNPTSTNNIQPSAPPKKEHETKIQYVYKHGTQTIVVDRPLTEEELSKLKFQLPNNRPQPQPQPPPQPQPQQAKQAIVVGRPSVASQPVARLVVPPSPSAASSVETLANTLISQIQTPVQLTPTGQPIKTEDQKPSPGALPKFQFAFGGRDSNPVIKTEPGLVVVKSEPLDTSNGKILISSPTQHRQQLVQTPISAVALKGTNLVSLPSKPAPQIVVQTSSASQSQLVSGQVTLQASPSAASHADLIKQLNQARAQGLVVLQQWGDKQVLVHKATGRWIMRQGNRLVTVPPQALGIQASGTDQAAPAAGTATQTTTVASPTPQSPTTNNLMSTSTMEQLREFDSILESKFKTTTFGGDETKQVVATSSSPATFVIIAPQQQQQQQQPQQLSNFVKCEPGGQDFAQVKTSSTSSSAPTSPSKPIKIPPTSASASASPLGNSVSSALGFAKPSPKPQEDPDTLKRIQQILDDYNEQIRNSPDLQNRPAPRRRTNGPTIINSGVSDSAKRKRLSSVSPPPSSSLDSSDVGSPSVVQISSASVIDTNHMTLKVLQKPASENGEDGMTSSTTPTQAYSVVRQIVVPPSLAASLQASGRQIMVVTGPGGKKMVAVKPVFSGTGSPNVVKQFVAVSHGALPARLVTSTTTSSASSSNASSPEISSSNSATMAKAIAALKSAVPVSIVSSSITSLSSSTTNVRPTMAMMPTYMVASPQPNVVNPNVVTSPSIILSNERASPNLILQSVVNEERPPTPGLGIPMEMTPGQIMEAEISAATFLDDNPDSPFALMSSASSSSLRRRKHEDEESLSETLPENLFTQDLPGTSSDEDDDYQNDLYGVTTTTTTTSNIYGKRKRHISSTSSEELSTQKRSRVDTRHRNLSRSKGSGNIITNGNVISNMFANDASQLINN